MRHWKKTSAALSLVLMGYALGASGVLTARPLGAQGAVESTGPSDEARKKVTEALNALKTASETLEQENLYMSATTNLNVFAVSAGGIHAINDLEEGRGVDPETFAALYAGEAKPEVKEHLDTDDQGRLTYKGKVVRIYPKARMKKVYQERLKYTGGGPKTKP